MQPEKPRVVQRIPIRPLVKRLLIGAAILAGLLVIGYFVLIGTSLGHRLANAAFTGRLSLSRVLANAFTSLLDLVS